MEETPEQRISRKYPDLLIENKPKTSKINVEADAFPTNENIQNALDEHRETTKFQNISIIDNEIPEHDSFQLRAEPNTKPKDHLSKRMDSFKSSVLSHDSSQSSNYDQMSEKFGDMNHNAVQEDDFISHQQKLRRGHKKNAQTLHRVLPSPGELEQYLSIRKPPDEEFFLMTLLSYKLNHPHMEKI